MKKKMEVALNIALIALTLLLTMVLVVNGVAIAAMVAGGIALLNIVALVLRLKSDKKISFIGELERATNRQLVEVSKWMIRW